MYCFNIFRNQLWQHLISYNSLRNVNMCLFEVVMCEKCRSSSFQSEGGSKKFEDWRRGIKNFRTGGGLLLLAAVSTPLHTMTHNRFYVILCRAKYFVELKKVPAIVKIFSSSWKILKKEYDYLLSSYAQIMFFAYRKNYLTFLKLQARFSKLYLI